MLSHSLFQNQQWCHKLNKRKKRKRHRNLASQQGNQWRSPSENPPCPRRSQQRNPRKLWSLPSPLTLANKSLDVLLKYASQDQLGRVGLRGILVSPAMSLANLSATLTIAFSKMTQLERSFTRKSKDRRKRGCETCFRRLKQGLVLCSKTIRALKAHVTLFSSIALKLALKSEASLWDPRQQPRWMFKSQKMCWKIL